jgi:hypothetical protein
MTSSNVKQSRKVGSNMAHFTRNFLTFNSAMEGPEEKVSPGLRSRPRTVFSALAPSRNPSGMQPIGGHLARFERERRRGAC